MGWKLKKSVVMVGMMGAGKSAVGRATAQLLGVPFRDSDAEIEAAANMSIAEIFARDGEDFFRQKERQVIARLLEETPSILSTGWRGLHVRGKPTADFRAWHGLVAGCGSGSALEQSAPS